MQQLKLIRRVVFSLASFTATIVLGIAAGGSARAQATATATEGIQLTTFAGATGTQTGLGGAFGTTADSRNLAITAGFTAGIRPFFRLYPALEIRGTYPIMSGSVAGEKNVLLGLSVSKHYGHLQPYANILFGRGELNFKTPYPNPADTIIYVQTAGSVFSPGAGFNYFAFGQFGIKADFQYQRYQTPVTTSGSIGSKALTLGIIYRIGGAGLSRVGNSTRAQRHPH